MSDLTEFLLARLAEDEAATISERDWWDAYYAKNGTPSVAVTSFQLGPGAYWRVLADVEAKRRIVEGEGAPYPAGHTPPTRTLRLLASVYSDHADYNPSWRV